jgi:hypothetical protein
MATLAATLLIIASNLKSKADEQVAAAKVAEAASA